MSANYQRLRIGMVLDNRFPPDERVEKEALSLITAGFEVFLLCFNFGTSAAEENYKGIQIRRVFMPRWLYRKLSALILTLPFYKWFWKKRIANFVREEKIDCLHIHDLPIFGTAIELKKMFSIHTILDMHEDWADWIVNTRHYRTYLGKIVGKLSKWEKYQRRCLALADIIFVVSEKIRSKYISKYTLNESQVINLPNTPDLSKFELEKIDHSIQPLFENRFTLIYVGVIDYLRGLQTIIPHIQKLTEKIPNIQLIIVGSGNYSNILKQKVQKLNLQNRVIFTGWVSSRMVSSYLYFSNVGLYPQLKYTGIDDTIPTKLYEYCLMGIPVITSNHQMAVEFLTKYKCGFGIDFQKDIEKFYGLIIDLNDNPVMAKKRGENGRKAILSEYNWDKTSRALLDTYRYIDDKLC